MNNQNIALQKALSNKVSNNTFESYKEYIDKRIENISNKKTLIDLNNNIYNSLEEHINLINNLSNSCQDINELKADKYQVTKDIINSQSELKSYTDNKITEFKLYTDEELLILKNYIDNKLNENPLYNKNNSLDNTTKRLSDIEKLIYGENGISLIIKNLNLIKEDINIHNNKLKDMNDSIFDYAYALNTESNHRKINDKSIKGLVEKNEYNSNERYSILNTKIADLNLLLKELNKDILFINKSLSQETLERLSSINSLDSKINTLTPTISTDEPTNKNKGHIWIEILK